MTNIGSLPDGARGFDCDVVVGSDEARIMKKAGFDFALRYVRRSIPHAYDVSKSETLSLLNAGLGVMLAQHVAPVGWLPSASLGMAYGETAANEAHAVGLPSGVSLWCDQEGVQTGAPSVDVIGYGNEWHDAVERRGYLPGLYVGDQCGLTGRDLYKELRFASYCGAYNVNSDCIPIIRGWQMKQHAYPAESERAPVAFEYDTLIIMHDQLGGTPVLYLP